MTSDDGYRAGAVDLLGILAYGALTAFERLAEDAVLSMPPLREWYSGSAAVATYYGTAEKARRELGWTARPLEKGLAETVAGIRGS